MVSVDAGAALFLTGKNPPRAHAKKYIKWKPLPSPWNLWPTPELKYRDLNVASAAPDLNSVTAIKSNSDSFLVENADPALGSYAPLGLSALGGIRSLLREHMNSRGDIKPCVPRAGSSF